MLRTSHIFKNLTSSTRYFHSTAYTGAKKVLATRKLLPTSQERLEKQGFELIQWPKDSSMPRDLFLEQVKGAEGIICMLSDKIDKELLDAAGPQLKVVSTMSVGYDHIDLKTARENNVQIGYTPDVLTDATADLTVLLTLAAARNMKVGVRACETGQVKYLKMFCTSST
jgi:glyoxylate/hydroxypyruvate reductase